MGRCPGQTQAETELDLPDQLEPPSLAIRCAKPRPASRSVGSFKAASACRGVFVRGRRDTQTSRLGASNVAKVG
jgi:hypothetical protein